MSRSHAQPLDIRVVSASVRGEEVYRETEVDGERVGQFTRPDLVAELHACALKPHYPHITQPVPSARHEQPSTRTG
jgi:hypothetical protein